MIRGVHFNALKRLPPAWIFLLLLTSCAPDVPDATEYASLFFEYDYIAGWHINNISLDKSGVDQATQYLIEAFHDVGLTTNIAHDDNDIPQYDTLGTPFPDNEEALRNYAKSNDRGDFPWHLLSVDKYAPNQSGGGITHGRAADLNNGNHLPPSPPEERYSIIFTQDIVDSYSLSGDNAAIAAALITTAVHELGHQRAGLTDANAYPDYHGNDCLMHGGTPFSLTPKFCKTFDTNNQTSTCLQIIKDNYGNF